MVKALLSTILLVSLASMACSGPAPTVVVGPTSAPQPSTTVAVASQAVQTQPTYPSQELTIAATPTPKPKPTATASRISVPTAMAMPPSTPAAETDREALIALYKATDGQNWIVNHSWLTDAPIRDWYGVEVDPQGHVVELILSRNRLSGEIPPELGDLVNLTRLFLDGNQLNGCVPASLHGRAVSDLSHC